MSLRLYLLRHSLTEGNTKKRYIGTTDEPLCQAGVEMLQAQSYPQVEAVYASPMRRCVQTARILYPQARIHIIDELRECDFGEFENRNYLELDGNENYQRWIDSNGTLPFPGGESRAAFRRRTLTGFQKAVTYCLREQCREAALVVHGGSIMNILETHAVSKNDFYQWRVENGHGYQVELDQGAWRQGKRSLSVTGKLPLRAEN